MGDALVHAQAVSVFVDEPAGGGDAPCFFSRRLLDRLSFTYIGLQKIGIVTVGHEADLLGVGLVRDGEAGLLRDAADVVLAVAAEGHEGRGQLLLAEAAEHVGLVLGGVPGGFDGIAAAGEPHDVGIVACGDVVRLHDLRGVEHFVPLDGAVADDAGVGGLAVQIAGGKGVDDIAGKFARAVQGVVLDPQLPGDSAGVVDLTAAALGAVFALPGAERHAAHFVSFLLQQICRHGAVHTSGHADQYFFHGILSDACRSLSDRKRGIFF